MFAQARIVALLAAAAILAFQLLIPPFIGLANNGDFPKVTGRLSLGPSGRWDNFEYFNAEYVRDARYHWVSDVWSSEILPAALALKLSEAAGFAPGFDIRWLGALQAALWLCALAIFVAALPPNTLAIAAFVWVLMFTDVCYVAYLNSFYSDAAALSGLLLTTGSGVYLCTRERPSWWSLILFAASALYFVSSKAQHGIWGWVPAVLLLVLSRRWNAPALRRAAGILAAVLTGVSGLVFWITPAQYKGEALFNILFFDQLKHSSTASADLRELGLDDSYARWIGTHAFAQDSPTRNPEWMRTFLTRTSYARLARFYAVHPVRALAKLNSDLVKEAPVLRPENLSNYQRRDGHPAGARTAQFGFWSSARAALYRVWPYHIVLWYLIAAGTSAWIAWTASGVRKRLAVLTLAIIAVALGEFAFASLADAAETYRHLLAFHALTDLTILSAVAFALDRIAQMKKGTTPAPF